ncbi:uncharacterized protein LOC117220044 [Megalopta genalis]|uniref:uncharacterized protein LOC117220044 n=1 Tax=Megalopta genalis TaxID=115081 RepID=UPI003FD26D95
MYGLYLLDIYVSELLLNKQVFTDVEGSELMVRVVVVDLPVAEIVQRKQFVKDENVHVFQFSNGWTCHFSAVCEQLVKALKRMRVHFGIFRKGDNYPICSVRSYLTGCACDLNTLKVDKPKSFMFRGPFDLVDSGRSFAGQLDATITISNLGRCVSTCYALVPNAFIFKGGDEEVEYKGGLKAMSPGEHRTMNLDVNTPEKLAGVVRDFASISPMAGFLASGSPPPRPPREPLVDPRAVRSKKKKGKKKKK